MFVDGVLIALHNRADATEGSEVLQRVLTVTLLTLKYFPHRSVLWVAGFGAMARHLPRLTDGLIFALDHGILSRSALSMLQPSSPSMDMTAAMQVVHLRPHQMHYNAWYGLVMAAGVVACTQITWDGLLPDISMLDLSPDWNLYRMTQQQPLQMHTVI